MIFGWPTERSTYHATMVNRVKSHLKRLYHDAGKERGFVRGRITDAYGYDKLTKTVFFCEVKVGPTDLLKSVFQIKDTVFRYTPKDPEVTAIPVIAVPKRLFDEWGKSNYDKWISFKDLCKTNKIALWIIEQSDIRQIQGPKPKALKAKVNKTVKAKKNTPTKAKKKTIKKRKPVTKTKVIRSPKTKKTTVKKSTPKTKTASTRKTPTKTNTKTKPKSTKKTTRTKTRKSVTKKPLSSKKVTKKR
jgi:hypothetical protein